jgi:hypothetical protein
MTAHEQTEFNIASMTTLNINIVSNDLGLYSYSYRVRRCPVLGTS